MCPSVDRNLDALNVSMHAFHAHLVRASMKPHKDHTAETRKTTKWSTMGMKQQCKGANTKLVVPSQTTGWMKALGRESVPQHVSACEWLACLDQTAQMGVCELALQKVPLHEQQLEGE